MFAFIPVFVSHQRKSLKNTCCLEELLPVSTDQPIVLCGDLEKESTSTEQHLERPHYSHLMLEWIRSFSDMDRQRIVLARSLDGSQLDKCMGYCFKILSTYYFQGNTNMICRWFEYTCRFQLLTTCCLMCLDTSEAIEAQASLVWDYLCAHGRIDDLLNWINTQLPLSEHETPPHSSWPYSLTCDFELSSCFSAATQFTRDRVLNELARSVERFTNNCIRIAYILSTQLNVTVNPSALLRMLCLITGGVYIVETNEQTTKRC